MSDDIAWRPNAQVLRGAPFEYGTLVLLIFAIQFGQALGLMGFSLGGDWRWALNGVLRDVLLLLLGIVGTYSALTPRLPLSASASWARSLVSVYSLFGMAVSIGLVPLSLNLRRLAFVLLLFVVLLLIPWSNSQVDGLLRCIVTTCVAVAVLGLIERLSPTPLWTVCLDIDRFYAANRRTVSAGSDSRKALGSSARTSSPGWA
jgi:hypothetical protein